MYNSFRVDCARYTKYQGKWQCCVRYLTLQQITDIYPIQYHNQDKQLFLRNVFAYLNKSIKGKLIYARRINLKQSAN
jgi:hypothetical protein